MTEKDLYAPNIKYLYYPVFVLFPTDTDIDIAHPNTDS